MAAAFRKSAALAILVVGGSALQLTPDAPGMCGTEMTAYEAFNPKFPSVCWVFCTPAGTCEGEVQLGQMESFGITGRGNCKHRGFTESVPLGNMSASMVDWLGHRRGPCKGMKMLKFQMPQTNEVQLKMTSDPKLCGKGQTPYEGISRYHPNECSLFCVPKGECEGMTQMGQLKSFGIIALGNCIDKGYTATGKFSADVNSKTMFTISLINANDKACYGMTIKNFQKPGSFMTKNAPTDEVCGKQMVPFQARSTESLDVCGLFCVPTGECEGQVHGGRFNYLGISGSGDCKSEGFTESATFGYASQNIVESLKYVYGPCRGMTYTKFIRPAH